jgi:hypothetical protein
MLQVYVFADRRRRIARSGGKELEIAGHMRRFVYRSGERYEVCRVDFQPRNWMPDGIANFPGNILTG